MGRPPRSTLFPYTTLFRSPDRLVRAWMSQLELGGVLALDEVEWIRTDDPALRSEEHTSELQSRRDLVCRLLLEKKKTGPRADCGHTCTPPDSAKQIPPCQH